MGGPDIFISYARANVDVARQYAEAFGAAGFNVWWDDDLRSGEVFDEAIEKALRAAKAVVVLWSPESVKSRWVRAEATLAERNKTFVPVTIEPCERPIVFELTHTPDLCGWDGDAGAPEWQALLKDVRNSLHSDEPAPASSRETAPLPSLDQLSVAVLPFANMSGDPEQEYFADGITEDVITDLSKVSALKVIARNTVFTLKGQHVDVGEIARKLNVTHVVEGSVRKAGNRVRVTAQLIDGSDNAHVWAERWDRNLDDIFELQDELSQEIVKALRLNLLPDEQKELSSRGTDNVEAYDLAIRARAQHLTFGRSNSRKAVELFRDALELDPNFADAWLGLANSLGNLLMYEPEHHDELFGQLLEAHRRGMAIDPDSSLAWLLTAEIASWTYDWPTLSKALEKATAFNVFSGHYFATLGRGKEAAERQLNYRVTDPLSIGTSFVTQYLLDGAGRLDEAEIEYERSRGLVGPRVTMEWRALTRAMVRGDSDRVKMIYKDRFEGDNHFQYYRADLTKVLDDPEAALKVLGEALTNPEFQDGARMAAVANWAIFYGDNGMALDALRRGFVERKHGIATVDLWQPNLAGLRRDPRFKQILLDMGLADFWRKSGNWGDFARPVGDNDFEIIA
jgi:adenylate cyclase